MNQIATQDRSPMNSVGFTAGATGGKIAPQNLGEVVRFAEVMCRADIALPKHLRGNAGACMAVALQALEWDMSPFAVASKSYSVNGQIAYEAQLIMAVINTRSGIEGRLKFRFEGEGGDRVCIAYGKIDGEELDVRSPKFKDITPKNSPLWKSDPDQQHCYYTARAWGRRHTPEVILGVYDREEAEQFRGSETARDITPSLSERLKLAKIEQHDGSQTREGFNADFVTRETSALTDEPENEQDEQISESSDGESPSATDDSGGEFPSSLPAASNPQESGEPAGADDKGDESTAPAALSNTTRALMDECMRKMLAVATDADVPDPAQRRGILERTKDAWKVELSDHLPFVKACFESADRVIKGGNAKTEREYLEGLIGRAT